MTAWRDGNAEGTTPASGGARGALRRRGSRRWRPPARRRGLQQTILEITVAFVLGAALGTLLATGSVVEAVPGLRTAAWVSDPGAARTALGTLMGIQVTLVTIVLSITTLTYQSVASQYSPRLVALLASSEPLYRAIALFALSGAYTVAGVRQLGLTEVDLAAPRPVVVGGILLLVLAIGVVIADLIRVFQRIQVEEMLRAVAAHSLGAARRLTTARSALAPPAPPPQRPAGAIPIPAPHTGYLITFDLDLLDELARRAGARVRIDRRIGEYVVAGEPLGWLHAPGVAATAAAASAFGQVAHVSWRRRSLFDVGLGLRVLADIANRALSPAVNDPTTACQALHQMRVVLHEVAVMPLGDITIPGDDGAPRVSLSSPDLADYLAAGVDGPSRYGAADPDVIADILTLALEVGRAAPTPDRRAAARSLAARAVADAAELGHMDASRLAVLRAREAAVAHALGEGAPSPRGDGARAGHDR
jgi:uncharacterized membrane protein